MSAVDPAILSTVDAAALCKIAVQDLMYLADEDVARVVLGATVPIVLASRADTVRAPVASAALALFLAGESTH